MKEKMTRWFRYTIEDVKAAQAELDELADQSWELAELGIFTASFRRAVVDALVDKAVLAALDSAVDTLALAGGVASNRLLRRELTRRGEQAGLRVLMPPPRLCTDNAEMIGSAAFYRLMAGQVADLSLNAQPSCRLVEAQS